MNRVLLYTFSHFVRYLLGLYLFGWPIFPLLSNENWCLRFCFLWWSLCLCIPVCSRRFAWNQRYAFWKSSELIKFLGRTFDSIFDHFAKRNGVPETETKVPLTSRDEDWVMWDMWILALKFWETAAKQHYSVQVQFCFFYFSFKNGLTCSRENAKFSQTPLQKLVWLPSGLALLHDPHFHLCFEN